MTAKQIDEVARRAALKFETARKIRELLDSAAKELGDTFDESEVLELVTEEPDG